MDTASPVQNKNDPALSIGRFTVGSSSNIIPKKSRAEGRGRERKKTIVVTCGAEYDLYRGGNAERKHEIVQQRARRESGDLEQPLRDGDLARLELEPREPGARLVPGYEGWHLLSRDEEHLRERECGPYIINQQVSQSETHTTTRIGHVGAPAT